MFARYFSQELASRIGTSVEVATDNNLFDGTLSAVNPTSILVINTNGGYGQHTRQFIQLDAINFVRFPIIV